jgi:acetyl-CoA synthetase
MLEKFLSKVDFDSYEDFIDNFKINVPDNFNFAYDVVDEIAAKTPDKIAIVWCDENGNEATFTFGQLKEYSNKAANFFKRVGVKKGDPVMLILKKRYEFWFAVLALHKIGAVAIPATHLLTAKDNL